MEVLRLVRRRGGGLTPGPASRLRALGAGVLVAVAAAGCAERPDPDHLPDEVLRRELGLTDADRVHTVRLVGGSAERAEPDTDTVPVGAWVQFVSADWLVHEVAFERDSLTPAAWTFLTETDQVRSPPLLQLDARFVVSLAGAPAGRYVYVLEGNAAPGSGAFVVVEPDPR